jgi:hypothetical protein
VFANKGRELGNSEPVGVSTTGFANPNGRIIVLIVFSSTSFTRLERDRAVAAGQSRSDAKVAAARRNGKESKNGGRPPTRTLAERLLGRTLRKASERVGFGQAFEQLLAAERQDLLRFFGVHSEHARVPVMLKPTRITNQWRPPLKGRARDRALNPTVSVLHSKAWRQQTRRQPREIRYLIRKLKLAASQFVPPAS